MQSISLVSHTIFIYRPCKPQPLLLIETWCGWNSNFIQQQQRFLFARYQLFQERSRYCMLNLIQLVSCCSFWRHQTEIALLCLFVLLVLVLPLWSTTTLLTNLVATTIDELVPKRTDLADKMLLFNLVVDNELVNLLFLFMSLSRSSDSFDSILF